MPSKNSNMSKPGQRRICHVITERLELEALTPAHAEVLFHGLKDRRLYRFIDVEPPASVEMLRRRYERLATQRSPDGSETWLNWAVRKFCNQEYIGFVQATVANDGWASIAFVLFHDSWGQGYGKEAVAAMLTELQKAHGISRFRAFVNTRNRRSKALLQSLGFEPCGAKDAVLPAVGRPSGELEYVLHNDVTSCQLQPFSCNSPK
jgi:[ribosomal protein S5]-alanine N-acetyltransferase